MQKGQSRMGQTYYFPTMATSLRRTLLDAIVLDEAKPLPPDASLIMDDMFWWGKTVSFEWYEQVVDSLGVCLYGEEEFGTRGFVREVIGFQVKAIILEYFNFDSMAFDLLFDRYFEWFFWTYSEQDVYDNKYSFRGMAEASFDYVKWCVAQVNYYAHTPVALPVALTQPVTPEPVVNSA
jgi:hypothetical protein